MYAIEADLEKLTEILEDFSKLYPIDVDYKEFDDMTALHYACQEGHKEVVELLLHYKANIEAPTVFKRTPLIIAVLRGNLEIVEVIYTFLDKNLLNF